MARLELNLLAELHASSSLNALSFHKNASGRPILDQGWHCSISHSFGWVLVGLSRARFGVDIEKICEKDYLFLESAFTAEEWKIYCSRPERAFTAFSIKESLSKMMGTGFLTEPNQIQLNGSEYIRLFRMNCSTEADFIISITSSESFTPVFQQINPNRITAIFHESSFSHSHF